MMKQISRIRKILITLAFLTGITVCVGLSLHSRARQREANLTLVAALNNNDIEMARKAVEQGADVNIRENLPEPTRADGFLGRLKGLLFPVRTGYGTGKTALVLAAGSEDLEFVNLLLKRGADVNNRQESVLCAAADGQFVPAVNTPGQKDSSVEVYRQKLHSLPVYEVLRTLIDHGLKIDNQSADYLNALSSICQFSDPKSERLLLQYGEKLKITDKQAYNPMLAAIGTNRYEVVKALLDRGASAHYNDQAEMYYILSAAQRGTPEIVTLLLDRGADVNVQDDGCSFSTPLIAAIARKRPASFVKLLLDRGAKVNGADASGKSPLEWAFIVGDSETIALLRKAGAKTVWHSECLVQVAPILERTNGLELMKCLTSPETGSFIAPQRNSQQAISSNLVRMFSIAVPFHVYLCSFTA
jgi:ankyrin repeat protein